MKVDRDLNNTSACINFLNTEYSDLKWKRVSKFLVNYQEVRVFTNSLKEYVTIVSGEYDSFLLKEVNLQENRDLIKKIQAHSKNYYTHDYGEIWFNPKTMSLYCNCGDGGYVYSTKPSEVVRKLFDEDGLDDNNTVLGEKFISFEDQPDLTELKDTEYEAECDPDEDSDYILIGQMTLIE